MPWWINTGKSLIPLTLRFFAHKRNLLIPLGLSGVMHQGRVVRLQEIVPKSPERHSVKFCQC